MLQNLGWAIADTSIALPVAPGLLEPSLGLVLRPEGAALAMSGSSFLFATNALRLKRLRLPRSGRFEQGEPSESTPDVRCRPYALRR